MAAPKNKKQTAISTLQILIAGNEQLILPAMGMPD
jgi:hypothetical protein